MKDKLYKHGKKKSYFVVRKILIIALGLFFAASAVAVPVSVSYALIQSHATETQR